MVVNRSARAACKDAAYERRVALFLTKNELTRPSQLKKAEHPREWFGAFEFNDEELEAIRNLQEVPQSVSGPASAALLQLAATDHAMLGWESANGPLHSLCSCFLKRGRQTKWLRVPLLSKRWK